MKMYKHYQNQYDFELSKRSYRSLVEEDEDFLEEDGDHFY